MDIYYEIRLDADKWESQIDLVREACYRRFGAPIYVSAATDYHNYWLRTTKLQEIELAQELLGRNYIEKKIVRNNQDRLDSSRGFTWGT